MREVNQKRPPGRGMGHGPMALEKPKNFKQSMGKLLNYMGRYRWGVFVVMICAGAATVLNVVGPKIMGKATTALAEGLMAKIQKNGRKIWRLG